MFFNAKAPAVTMNIFMVFIRIQFKIKINYNIVINNNDNIKENVTAYIEGNAKNKS